MKFLPNITVYFYIKYEMGKSYQYMEIAGKNNFRIKTHG